MRWLFFNERRLRSGWRLLLFIMLLFGLSFFFASIFFASYEPPQSANEAGTLQTLLLNGLFILPLLLASLLMTRYVDGRPLISLGLGLGLQTLRQFFIGALLGALMISSFFVIALGLGWLKVSPQNLSVTDTLKTLSLYALGLLGAAVFEELLSKGYVFQTLLEGVGVYSTVFLTSVAFSLLHMGNPHMTLLGLINLGLAGVLFAVAYLRTRALWLPMGLHFTWNFFQYGFGLPISGIEFPDSPLKVELTGPLYLTGGAFGPEGGLITTAIFAITIDFLMLSKKLKPEERMAKLWADHLYYRGVI